MPREIIVDWTTVAGAGKVSVFFFGIGLPPADQRDALSDFLTSVSGTLTSTTSWQIRTTGRELNDATGALQAQWTEGTGHSGAGSASGSPIPDASQLMFRWFTNEIVGGRFLQGRTFIPGLTTSALTSGNLTGSVKITFDGYAGVLAASGAGLGVWHRPVLGSGGVFEAAEDGEAWSELAVLRRRRN